MWKIKGGRCIYQASNSIKVYQNFLYRWLTLDSSAIQTIINRRHLEKPELSYIHQLGFAVREQPANCCLLGLGGAAIVHSIAPYLNNSTILAVENNAEIIQIAAHYFMTDRIKNLSILHQDANLFVQQHNSTYQHVIVDLFDAHSFPKHCNSQQFFANCKRLLLPHGILAVNLANLHEQWPVFQHIRETFHQHTISLPVKGVANMVILACNSPSITPLLDLFKNNQCVKRLSWDAHWGCIAQI